MLVARKQFPVVRGLCAPYVTIVTEYSVGSESKSYNRLAQFLINPKQQSSNLPGFRFPGPRLVAEARTGLARRGAPLVGTQLISTKLPPFVKLGCSKRDGLGGHEEKRATRLSLNVDSSPSTRCTLHLPLGRTKKW